MANLLQDVTMGTKVQSRKDNSIGTISTLNEVDGKLKAEITLTDGTTKKASESTFKRWWIILEQPAQAPQAPQQEEQPAEVQVVEQEQEQPAQAPQQAPAVSTNAKAGKGGRKPIPVADKVQIWHNRIFSVVTSWGDNVTTKEVKTYKGIYVNGKNICEVHLQKRGIKLHLNKDSLNKEQKALCRVVPESYLWTMDALFKVDSEESFLTGIELLKAGYAFRAGKLPN